MYSRTCIEAFANRGELRSPHRCNVYKIFSACFPNNFNGYRSSPSKSSKSKRLYCCKANFPLIDKSLSPSVRDLNIGKSSREYIVFHGFHLDTPLQLVLQLNHMIKISYALDK